MNSTPSPKAIEPDDVLVARADQRLAHAYAQIARADEQIARVNEQIQSSTTVPRPILRLSRAAGQRAADRCCEVSIGLLLAAGIFLAAFFSQSPYGDAARLMIAGWTPQRLLTSPPPPESGTCRADEPITRSVGRGGASSRDQSIVLRRRLLRRTPRRRPPRWRPSWRSCSRRWRVTSQTRSRASNSSRRARNRQRAKMPGRSKS